MPVVINEFEVVDTPQGAPERHDDAAPTPQYALPDPQDLRRLLAEQAEQQMRLWAH
ncbi:hypothetical protein OOT46_26510 [Aquabacterium sp. A7-Y]|uniref:hypothetical protein n=1 Tax=Aquabacterium sp. A7-Y TaxID=1349605 RepID=UPI00223DF15E|nr:hypothetical protein [Aquabacterium sp. A7-Y]MCW7541369.1 hypothetical protein [Aquabacterium sp. A7-Y]